LARELPAVRAAGGGRLSGADALRRQRAFRTHPSAAQTSAGRRFLRAPRWESALPDSGVGISPIPDVKESAVTQPNRNQQNRDDDRLMDEDMDEQMPGGDQPQQQESQESRTTRDSGSKRNPARRSDKSSDSSSGQRQR
jgi:hypothetical protein